MFIKFRPQAQIDLKRYSFLVSEKIAVKIRQYMTTPFEKLKSRIVSVASNSSQQQIQQPLTAFSNFAM